MRPWLALALALATALAACATGDDIGSPLRRPRGDGPGLNVFISPSGEPFRAGPDAPYPSAAWFAGADANHDGRLSPEEFAADADRAFALWDTDGNSVIDGFEISAYERAVPEILPRVGRLGAGEGMDPRVLSGGRGRGGGRGGRGGGPPLGSNRRLQAGDTLLTGAAAFAMLNEPEPLRAADTDLDGRVTRAEWREKTRRRFRLLDDKGLGYLTLDALPKTAVQQVRERRRPPPPAGLRP